jgi:hypothetical protein
MGARRFVFSILLFCAGAGMASAQTLPASGDGIRNFGVWLDDATVSPPGGAWASLAFGVYRSDLLHEVDAPVADAGVGLIKRVQVGFTVPVYNAGPPDGQMSHGLGDLYIYSKIQMRDPSASKSDGFGWALEPLVEVLSAEQPEGVGRMHWALPVSLELQRTGWRAYGSTGFFSRGSLFAAGALEKSLTDRMWVTGTISDSYSTKSDVVPIPGLSRNRADVSGGAGYALTSSFAVFGSIGRTISMHDENSANMSLSIGCSVTMAPAPAPIRKPPHRPRR